MYSINQCGGAEFAYYAWGAAFWGDWTHDRMFIECAAVPYQVDGVQWCLRLRSDPTVRCECSCLSVFGCVCIRLLGVISPLRYPFMTATGEKGRGI